MYIRYFFSYILFILIVVLLLFSCDNGTSPEDEKPPVKNTDAYEQNAKLARSVNLGNALEAPNEGDWGVVLEAKYFTLIKEAGFTAEQIGVYLLVGLPDQSKFEIEDDIALVLNSGAHPKLAEYSPIPGTQMWNHAVSVSRYPIAEEPLFHNCTLLPAANPEVDSAFLRVTRKRIRESLEKQQGTVFPA